MPVAIFVASMPPLVSIWNCNAPPAAAPPGTTLLSALEAS